MPQAEYNAFLRNTLYLPPNITVSDGMVGGSNKYQV